MSRPGESAHPDKAKGVFDHAEKYEIRKTPPKKIEEVNNV
jgi:predicted transcriptional regulator